MTSISLPDDIFPIYNIQKYKKSTVNFDITEYANKNDSSNQIFTGQLSSPSITTQIIQFNGSTQNIAFTDEDKINLDELVIETPLNTLKLTDIDYNDTILTTTINNNCYVENIICGNINTLHLNETTGNLQTQITNNIDKIQNISYEGNLLNKTSISNNCFITNLTCGNFNTAHLTDTNENLQAQINILKNVAQTNVIFTETMNGITAIQFQDILKIETNEINIASNNDGIELLGNKTLNVSTYDTYTTQISHLTQCAEILNNGLLRQEGDFAFSGKFINTTSGIDILQNEFQTLHGLKTFSDILDIDGEQVRLTIQEQLDSKESNVSTIDAVRIADGTVTNANFQTLNGITTTSTIQAQLNSKESATSKRFDASRIGEGTVSNEILHFISNLSSNCQAQLNSKESSLSTNINSNRIADGTVSDTTFQYINSLTSNIQDQITELRNNTISFFKNIRLTTDQTQTDIERYAQPDYTGKNFSSLISLTPLNETYRVYQMGILSDGATDHTFAIGVSGGGLPDPNIIMSLSRDCSYFYGIKNPLVPVGSIMNFAGSTAPVGYLLCQGQTLNKTTYSSLYSVIGNTFLNGRTASAVNFYNIDLRQCFIKGSGNNGTYSEISSFVPITATGEFQKHSVQKHMHDYLDQGSGTRSNVSIGGASTTTVANDTSGTGKTDSFNLYSESGTTLDNETRPNNISLNYIIKY